MKATTLHEESSRDVFLYCRKATVQLNNVGVSLLHRGCLRQAIETFTDALAVTKLGCRAKSNMFMNCNDQLASPTLLAAHFDSSNIKKILNKANDRLSHPEPSTLCGIELEVISDDENPAEIQSRCLVEKEGTESSVNMRKENFVIQMDHLNVSIPREEEDMIIQCSIICYNYGVAYLCLSTLPKSPPFVDQLYMGALKMFQLAFSTLKPYHSKNDNLQSHQMNRALLTGLLVLHNLILLSTTLPGMAKERDEYLQCLVHIKQFIHEFAVDFHRVVSSSSTARAA